MKRSLSIQSRVKIEGATQNRFFTGISFSLLVFSLIFYSIFLNPVFSDAYNLRHSCFLSGNGTWTIPEPRSCQSLGSGLPLAERFVSRSVM